MPNFSTDRYSMLTQKCKDCPWLNVKPDGEHVDCNPPMGECPAEMRAEEDHARAHDERYPEERRDLPDIHSYESTGISPSDY